MFIVKVVNRDYYAVGHRRVIGIPSVVGTENAIEFVGTVKDTL
jgi:hypothetical protein